MQDTNQEVQSPFTKGVVGLKKKYILDDVLWSVVLIIFSPLRRPASRPIKGFPLSNELSSKGCFHAFGNPVSKTDIRDLFEQVIR